ncbi:hypothetical protein [Paenibacillus polymyxa]|uniref:hypothetical protein n=1 Tax=Paenibacillus polymyxa TaxID=1406 RepID=UPI00159EFC12|nr:hypothetical protein [Paenibacillus polymyxa]
MVQLAVAVNKLPAGYCVMITPSAISMNNSVRSALLMGVYKRVYVQLLWLRTLHPYRGPDTRILDVVSYGIVF